MTYRPMASLVIEQLQTIVAIHGDVEVVVYDNSVDEEYHDIEIEYNDDDGKPVVLIGIDPKEERENNEL